jgi:hypothetical protein
VHADQHAALVEVAMDIDEARLLLRAAQRVGLGLALLRRGRAGQDHCQQRKKRKDCSVRPGHRRSPVRCAQDTRNEARAETARSAVCRFLGAGISDAIRRYSYRQAARPARCWGMTSRQPLHPAIQGRIIDLRERRVRLDADLAQLYGVETRVPIQSVKRNGARFPGDFMIRLTPEEFRLTPQIVISNIGRGGRRTPPYAFTEQRVAMLSSVLGTPAR